MLNKVFKNTQHFEDEKFHYNITRAQRTLNEIQAKDGHRGPIQFFWPLELRELNELDRIIIEKCNGFVSSKFSPSYLCATSKGMTPEKVLFNEVLKCIPSECIVEDQEWLRWAENQLQDHREFHLPLMTRKLSPREVFTLSPFKKRIITEDGKRVVIYRADFSDDKFIKKLTSTK